MNDRAGPPLTPSPCLNGVAPPGLDAVLAHLRSGRAHAALTGEWRPVEAIETHMSWVFIAGRHVLKLKKPVHNRVLDFSTLALREAACLEELRVNARLAPGIYRGLLALQQRPLPMSAPMSAPRSAPMPAPMPAQQPAQDALELVPEAAARRAPGATVEWLVWMRRLPRERMLDRAIAAGRVDPAAIDLLVATLVRFYREALPVVLAPSEHLARLQREQADNRAVLLHPLRAPWRIDGATAALDRLDDALRRSHEVLAERARRHLVDAHGDLRPEHVCLLRPPRIIDSVEFDATLRHLDPYDEIAFLALECEQAGAGWIGPRLWQGCAAGLGGVPPPCLLPLYTALRAQLRARLALGHLLDDTPRTPGRWAPLAQRYLLRSQRALDVFDRLGGAALRPPER